jgi:hypothetical protein
MEAREDDRTQHAVDVEVRFIDLWIPAQRLDERWIRDRHYSLIRWSGGQGHERLAWYDDADVRTVV